MLKKIISFYSRILQQMPALALSAVGLLLAAGLMDSVSMLSIAPIIDLLFARAGAAPSPWAQHYRAWFQRVGIPFELRWVAGLMAALILAKALLMVAVAVLTVHARIRFEERLKQKSFREILAAEWGFFAKEKLGELINSLTTESARAGSAFADACRLLALIPKYLFGVGVLFFISWKLTLVSLVVMVPFAVLTRWFSRYSYRYGRDATVTNNELFAAITESLSAIKIVKGYAAENQTYAFYNRKLQDYKKTMFKCDAYPQFIQSLSEPFGFISILLITVIGLRIAHLSAALMTVFLFALYRLVPALGEVSVGYARLLGNVPSLERVEDYSVKALRFHVPRGGEPISDIKESIRFEQAGFAYSGRDFVFDALDLTIPAGKTIAVVGSSGAGKSTLVDLIMGFIQVSHGHLRVDQKDLKELDIMAWRNLIGYVPQDVLLFHDSIYNNIAWASASATPEQVFEAARLAYADSFIKSFPSGYDTQVGERGVMLSGGQKQRIALARALIRKPKLLILDEATSALDSESEHAIQKVLESLSGKTTVILIAHRFSTIRHSDNIYFLEKGRVVESGTFDELMAKDGRFQQQSRVHG